MHSLCVVARTPLRDVTACSHLNSVRHPYGSGSLQSEPRSGGLYQFIHSRLMCIQSCFRASNLYAFWSMHRLHCRELFFTHKRKPCAGKAPVASAAGTDGKQEPPDKFAQTFGTAMPSRIPESTAWWKVVFCTFVS